MPRFPHLNYVRQVRKFLLSRVRPGKVYEPQVETAHLRLEALLPLMDKAVKFLLPPDGRTLNDPELRALDRDVGLHLPYPCIALEFSGEESKVLLLAEETNGVIFLRCVAGFLTSGGREGQPPANIWIHYANGEIHGITDRPSGLAIDLVVEPLVEGIVKADLTASVGIEANILLNFLNALACRNVTTERSDQKIGAKTKDSLPFDSYHVLKLIPPGQLGGPRATLPSNRRAPREHLRRGHVVRQASGGCYWRNSTVVNAGSAAGRIKKDYLL